MRNFRYCKSSSKDNDRAVDACDNTVSEAEVVVDRRLEKVSHCTSLNPSAGALVSVFARHGTPRRGFSQPVSRDAVNFYSNE